jgi:hypothetical protein
MSTTKKEHKMDTIYETSQEWFEIPVLHDEWLKKMEIKLIVNRIAKLRLEFWVNGVSLYASKEIDIEYMLNAVGYKLIPRI